jgi:hypothetical protein
LDFLIVVNLYKKEKESYPGNSSNGLLYALNKLIQSNLACEISASYVTDVHAGKQLHPFGTFGGISTPSIKSLRSNSSSASL